MMCYAGRNNSNKPTVTTGAVYATGAVYVASAIEKEPESDSESGYASSVNDRGRIAMGFHPLHDLRQIMIQRIMPNTLQK